MTKQNICHQLYTEPGEFLWAEHTPNTFCYYYCWEYAKVVQIGFWQLA